MDVISIFSALYADPQLEIYVLYLGPLDVRHHFQFQCRSSGSTPIDSSFSSTPSIASTSRIFWYTWNHLEVSHFLYAFLVTDIHLQSFSNSHCEPSAAQLDQWVFLKSKTLTRWTVVFLLQRKDVRMQDILVCLPAFVCIKQSVHLVRKLSDISIHVFLLLLRTMTYPYVCIGRRTLSCHRKSTVRPNYVFDSSCCWLQLELSKEIRGLCLVGRSNIDDQYPLLNWMLLMNEPLWNVLVMNWILLTNVSWLAIVVLVWNFFTSSSKRCCFAPPFLFLKRS